MTTISKATTLRHREVLLDFYRSCSMLFVFYHHIISVFPDWVDFFKAFNPFAEIFVLISGFMVGMVYLHREGGAAALLARAQKIFSAYFIIALPAGIGAALIGTKREPVLDAIVNVLSFRLDPTAIGILKFYGFMFLLLPIILPLYRANKLTTLLVSAILFSSTTYVTHVISPVNEDPLLSLLFALPQWQLFFMIGIFLGDLHRSQRLVGLTFYVSVALIFLIGIAVDAHFGLTSDGSKWPYSFEKFFNLLWTLPLMLLILLALYKALQHSAVLDVILNVGRNSLLAFLLSEIVRLSVKFVGVVFAVDPPIVWQQSIGLFGVVLVTFVLWLYQSHWKRLLTLALPLAGR